MPQEGLRTESIGFDDWLTEIDDAITTEIVECYPRHWLEDVITHKWLLAVTKRFRHVTIADLDAPFSVTWDAYKASGAVENKYGDVGVIVNFSFAIAGDRISATGVGFMEAKRVDRETLTYSHIRWGQLERQALNIAAHRVLLYDFDSVESAELNVQGHGFCRHMTAAPYHRAHAVTLITQHVLAAKKRNREVGTMGVPLGYQLCTRYLRGLDLDYSLDPAEFLESVPGGPSFLIVADVTDARGPIVTSGEPAPLPLDYLPITEAPLDFTDDSFVIEPPDDEPRDPLDATDLLEQFRSNPMTRRNSGPEIDIEEEDEAEGEVATT